MAAYCNLLITSSASSFTSEKRFQMSITVFSLKVMPIIVSMFISCPTVCCYELGTRSCQDMLRSTSLASNRWSSSALSRLAIDHSMC